ncbi:UPF0183-domain-containing protein [Neolentinus lepideus HHB14362 ss-1]|uniref:UPF0183-domain-containing protein n=1 Tax=Neolentinus lepideus HHB14362 ss-1 TaxID=1314782 RepID=A0A165P1C5_9AGAM|nr:UPF0183-domain-containing protein [Neolentinus lepideus HHB14362 ss-1]
MIATLDVDIKPGYGVGLFELGSSLWNVLDLLRSLPHIFPQVDVKYDIDSSVTTPIVLHIRPHLDLLFSGHHQRLHTICVRRLQDHHPPLIIRYKDIILSSPEEILRRLGVSRTFGPTYPGDDLHYPGVWFSFEEDRIGEGIKASSPGHVEDRMQEVKRVIVSQKGPEGDERDALDEVLESSSMHSDIAKAIVKVHVGVALYQHLPSAEPIHIRLGVTTAQDLLCDLGAPLRTHYKEDDRMSIHSTRETEEEEEGDYFYNYFQHGIDVLISGDTHTCKKIVMHTNIPGTPLFQRYKRCLWEIEGQPEDDEDDSPPRMKFYDRFESINHFLSPREMPPSMILDRTDDEEDLILPNSTTRLMGYDGIILEVTEFGHVVTVMLF